MARDTVHAVTIGWRTARWRHGVVIGLVLLGVCGAVASIGILREALPLPYALHGGLMLLAWAVLFPLGVIVARYVKVTGDQDFPRVVENLFWFNWHRALQYAGAAVALAAAIAIVAATGLRAHSAHAWLGRATLLLLLVQVLMPQLRGSKGGPTDVTPRGDHYDMTRRRRIFEAAHKLIGVVALLAAAATIATGLDIAAAPAPLPVATGALIAGLLAVAAWLELSGHHVDNYIALWGTDPSHPGNRRRLRRPADAGVRDA